MFDACVSLCVCMGVFVGKGGVWVRLAGGNVVFGVFLWGFMDLAGMCVVRNKAT